MPPRSIDVSQPSGKGEGVNEVIPAQPDYRVTHPLRPIIAAGALTFTLFTLTVAIVYFAARGAPAAAVRPLLVYTSVYLLAWLLAMLVMVRRQPSPAERVRIWSRGAVAIILGSHLACIWLIWGVMPLVAADIQLLIAIPLLGSVPSQVIASPESSLANRVGIFGVLGSLALFFFTRHAAAATLAALYVGGFALVMFVLANRVNQTVRETVAARLASDAAATQLERLLAAVAAERDAKTRFIAAASHDLGQPLQAAALFFDQTLRAADELSRMRAAEGVRRAFAAADQLLSHMLGHLRLEADAVEPHPSRIMMRALLQRIAAQYAPAAALAGMRIDIAGSDLMLLLDPALIERALGNLLHNAIVHSGGSRALVAVRRHGPAAVRLWVVDNGAGVGRVDARHIFDDYYQAAVTAGAVRSGFGLGLSSVRRIAAVMGGGAGLDARWRKGAAFYLEFPVAETALQNTAANAERQAVA